MSYIYLHHQKSPVFTLNQIFGWFLPHTKSFPTKVERGFKYYTVEL
jgi:hypothetical protein